MPHDLNNSSYSIENPRYIGTHRYSATVWPDVYRYAKGETVKLQTDICIYDHDLPDDRLDVAGSLARENFPQIFSIDNADQTYRLSYADVPTDLREYLRSKCGEETEVVDGAQMQHRLMTAVEYYGSQITACHSEATHLPPIDLSKASKDIFQRAKLNIPHGNVDTFAITYTIGSRVVFCTQGQSTEVILRQ